jgi:lipoyl(octanoyl) transferase
MDTDKKYFSSICVHPSSSVANILLSMLVQDLGISNYRDAWDLQEKIHAEVLAGDDERILFVEHPPVITFGRRPGGERNLLASADRLAALGVEIVQSDRGGDITLHAPGQLVAYPILRLVDHKLSVGGYVHSLEDAVIDTLRDFDLEGQKDPAAVGVWVLNPKQKLAKICAIGVRIRRGITLHGLALNVSTDLSLFDLIVPCGLQSRAVTSLNEVLGERAPSIQSVKLSLIQRLNERLSAPLLAPTP